MVVESFKTNGLLGALQTQPTEHKGISCGAEFSLNGLLGVPPSAPLIEVKENQGDVDDLNGKDVVNHS